MAAALPRQRAAGGPWPVGAAQAYRYACLCKGAGGRPAAARATGRTAPPSPAGDGGRHLRGGKSEEHTSELQSLMRISYAVFCLKNKNIITKQKKTRNKDERSLNDQ